MLNKACLALVGVLAFLPQMAVAADNPAGRCVDVSVPKNAITARNGRWIELTNEQWEFMRGIYGVGGFNAAPALEPAPPVPSARPASCWPRGTASSAER